MKVLQTIYGLNRKLGGPSSCTANLVSALNNVGVDTDILAIASQNADDDIVHGPNIHYVENDERTSLRISSNFNKFLNENGSKYELIHGNTIWLWHTHQASRYCQREDKTFVLSPHGMLYPQALRVSSWKKRLILPMFQYRDLVQANLIHATSMQELQHIRTFGLKNPVAVIPNMLLLEELPTKRHTANSIRQIGFVGRIHKIKNLDLLLKSWLNLGNLSSSCELIIIGEGDWRYEEELHKYVIANRMSNVRFAGFMSGKELHDSIKSLDYLVLPSKSENFGMVVAEALSYGVPVIASKGTPWEELESTKSGWWIEPDEETLTSALQNAILLAETKRQAMGENGRKLIKEKYLYRIVGNMMKQTYEWLLANRPKPDFIYV